MRIIPFPSEPLRNPEWTPVAPEKIVSGTPKSTCKILYTSPSGEFCGGIYECTPGKWKVSYAEDEFCTLIEGRVRLTDEHGAAQDFKAPESFMIPAGYRGTWEAVTPVRKFFTVYENSNK